MNDDPKMRMLKSQLKTELDCMLAYVELAVKAEVDQASVHDAAERLADTYARLEWRKETLLARQRLARTRERERLRAQAKQASRPADGASANRDG